ncbi:MAG: hypothetical protein KF802_02155 [Bdellovibrionaceae bacterium]|nr:hypothetical protein [Pseudobdellovibrionaceae bacterium]MBX3033879.1 hypothetical protein [Pseudobdellovibrionaceae bacterium]
MAVKKRKKTSKKSPARTGWVKTSKKMVDQVLVRMNPQLQDKIDRLIVTLESSREGKMGDLSLLAGKILMRAQSISQGLRRLKSKKRGAK